MSKTDQLMLQHLTLLQSYNVAVRAITGEQEPEKILPPACSRWVTSFQPRQSPWTGTQGRVFDHKMWNVFTNIKLLLYILNARNLFMQTYKCTERSTLNIAVCESLQPAHLPPGSNAHFPTIN